MTDSHNTASRLPQPLQIALDWPQPAPPSAGPDWKEPAKYQRDIAKWIVGGVLTAFVAIVAGSSLTKLGSLDFSTTPMRLIAALGGAAVGLGAIGVFLHRALQVLTVKAGSVYDLANERDAEWRELAAEVNSLFAMPLWDKELHEHRRIEDLIAQSKEPSEEKPLGEYDEEILVRANASLGFLLVQRRFHALIDCLPIVGAAAIFGLGLYAWAANPPEPSPAPHHGMTIKIDQ